jgi:hypothetical protein
LHELVLVPDEPVSNAFLLPSGRHIEPGLGGSSSIFAVLNAVHLRDASFANGAGMRSTIVDSYSASGKLLGVVFQDGGAASDELPRASAHDF